MSIDLGKISGDGTKFIELNFTDVFGGPKSIEIPIAELESALKDGVWFDGSSIEGFARIMESDMYLKLDADTYSPVHDGGDLKRGRIICDVFDSDEKPFMGDPRTALKQTVEKFEEQGYKIMFGPEAEFYLLQENGDGSFNFDSDSYFDSSVDDLGSSVRREVMEALTVYGITPERAHHEVAPSQHEIGFKYDEAVVTADRLITLKKVIRSVAQSKELLATFMPKPFQDKAGNGMHVHFSVFKEDKPLFYDGEDPDHLSPFAKHFIAGILDHVQEMSAVLHPTVNSYKRLVPGFEAPVYVSWGSRNRSSLVRIPRYTEGRHSSARAELRSLDPSVCPYLAFMVMMEAGFDGVKRELKLGDPVNADVYQWTPKQLIEKKVETLPNSLEEALGHMRDSEFMKKAMGETLFREYLSGKDRELKEFNIAVTDWEKARYLKNA